MLGGSKQTWILFCSRSLLTDLVTCPLKLSVITRAAALSPTVSHTFFTWGTMMWSMYCSVVSSVDQWLGEWVMCQSSGKEKRG